MLVELSCMLPNKLLRVGLRLGHLRQAYSEERGLLLNVCRERTRGLLRQLLWCAFCAVCSSLWRSERRTGVPTALYPLRGGAFHTEIAEKKAKSKDLIGSFFAV